jgi:hypothetical protein
MADRASHGHHFRNSNAAGVIRATSGERRSSQSGKRTVATEDSAASARSALDQRRPDEAVRIVLALLNAPHEPRALHILGVGRSIGLAKRRQRSGAAWTRRRQRAATFGRALWSRRGAEDDGEYARSAKRYRQALARDPTYLQSRVMSLGTWTERRSVFAFARGGCGEPAFLRQGDARARSSSGEQRKVMVAGESIPSGDRTFAVPLAAIPSDPRRH